MKRRTIGWGAMLATACVALMVTSATAGVIYTASATTSDGSPLSAMTPGAKLIIDITVRTTDFALGVAGSINGYDNSVLALDAGASTIASSVFNQFCFPAAGCFNGLANQVGTAITFQENAVGPGVEAEFLAALGLTPAGGNGSIDEGLGGVAGAAQFQIVFDYIGAPGTTTTLNIGTFAEYLDGYTGTVDSDVVNTSITVSNFVPEPGVALLLGLGLAGLSRVRGSERA